jgi:type I restriction enzyme S subunit
VKEGTNDELPEGWLEIGFDELNTFKSQTIDPSAYPEEVFELYSVPTFPTRKPEVLAGSVIGSTKQVVEPGDVLVCKINPRINRVWKVMPKTDKRQIASSEWIVMRAKGMNAEFLRTYFSSQVFREILCEDLTGVGGSLTRAQPKRVAKFRVPLAPLAEQKRIADKLEAVLGRVDTCRARLDRVPGLLKRFRQSVLAAATSGQLTEDWREENAANEEWENVQVRDIADEIFDGPFGSHLKTDDYTESGVRVVRLENIGSLQFFEEKQTFISLTKYQTLTRHTLKEHDVIFSSFISEEIRVSLLPKSWSGKAINKSDCFCVRTDHNKCLPKFLAFRLACCSTFVVLGADIHGATRPRINLGQLKDYAFELPPLLEQAEIVHRVETLFALADRIEARLATAQRLVERLTPATLSKAFRGDLVPQDPNDEPASALLERIQSHVRGNLGKHKRTPK